jgi:DNA invertase Pin-like site-specific DNA recombinase
MAVVHFRTADASADTSTSNGRLLLNILSSIAEFERDLIIERTRAGLANARKNGKRLGPPVKWQPEMVKQARRLMGRGDLTAQEVANMLKVSRRTLFNGLKSARDHDELLGNWACAALATEARLDSPKARLSVSKASVYHALKSASPCQMS